MVRSEFKPNLNSRRLQMNDKKALDKIFEEQKTIKEDEKVY